MADSLGRKPVIWAGRWYLPLRRLYQCVGADYQISGGDAFFHGLAATAASVVINALMRDIYPKEEFSRMMSFVMLVTTIAPLMAPIVSGWVRHG